MDSHDDRRVHQRMQVPQVLVKISTPERMRAAYLHDLSKGGLFIKTDRPLALERLIDVDLLPPGRATPIRVRCKVVRVLDDEEAKKNNTQGMGLKFVDLDPEMMIALDAVLEEYQRPPEPTEQPPAARPETGLLDQAFEEIAALKATLADRDRALSGARQRQEELEERVLAERAPSEDLQQELITAKAELGALQTQLSEALGDADAYRHELTVLQEALAQQKLELEAAHAGLLNEALAQQTRELDEAHAAHLDQALAQHTAEVEAAHAAHLQEALAEHRGEVEAHAAHLEQALAQQAQELDAAHAAHLEQVLAQQALEGEQQLEAERARRFEAERKESDLSGAKLQLTERIADLEGLVVAAREQMTAAYETTSQLESARARIAVLERGVSAPPKAAPAGGSPSPDFLRRLRANQPLRKLENFHTFTPTDTLQSEVMGLLEGSDCYSDLIVLGRSVATPEQLERTLMSFHQLTLIDFKS